MVGRLCTIWPLMRNICGDYAGCIGDYAWTVSIPDSGSGALEVVRLVGDGRSNDEIGAELGITTKTVEGHLRRLFERLGVQSRTELATRALREGWLEVP